MRGSLRALRNLGALGPTDGLAGRRSMSPKASILAGGSISASKNPSLEVAGLLSAPNTTSE